MPSGGAVDPQRLNARTGPAGDFSGLLETASLDKAIEIKRRVQPALKDGEIPVSSTRAGYIPGTHELGFDSEADTVIVRHTARSRQGFAEGALYAARWVVGKKGLFTFADVLQEGASATEAQSHGE